MQSEIAFGPIRTHQHRASTRGPVADVFDVLWSLLAVVRCIVDKAHGISIFTWQRLWLILAPFMVVVG